ncbi:hypothetical protein ACIPYQ_19190 [Streptomyces sp. NPDC090045]|uniref:hypothetical protein n=1 Tax=Streptomyces sp. NPDC090045 TaxID=3365927 RepID=UPI0038095A55
MTSLSARQGETSDGGRPLVIFIDEAAAVLGAQRSPLILRFPSHLAASNPVPTCFPNETKEDQ